MLPPVRGTRRWHRLVDQEMLHCHGLLRRSTAAHCTRRQLRAPTHDAQHRVTQHARTSTPRMHKFRRSSAIVMLLAAICGHHFAAVHAARWRILPKPNRGLDLCTNFTLFYILDDRDIWRPCHRSSHDFFDEFRCAHPSQCARASGTRAFPRPLNWDLTVTCSIRPASQCTCHFFAANASIVRVDTPDWHTPLPCRTQTSMREVLVRCCCWSACGSVGGGQGRERPICDTCMRMWRLFPRNAAPGRAASTLHTARRGVVRCHSST